MNDRRAVGFLYLIFSVIGFFILIFGIGLAMEGLSDASFNELFENVAGTVPVIGMGIVFLAFGWYNAEKMFRMHDYLSNLKENGCRIDATIDCIICDHSYSSNGRFPYIIYCSYVDPITGEEHKFEHKVWNDPRVIYAEGDYIDVYVDADDYEKYFVDAQVIN